MQQRIINIEDGKKKIKLHCDSNLYPLNDASASKIESLETKRFALEANAEGLECCLKKSQDKISLLNKEKSIWHSRLVFRQNLTSRLKTEVSKFEKGAIDIEDLKQKMMETEIQREIIRQRNCDSWTAAQISEWYFLLFYAPILIH